MFPIRTSIESGPGSAAILPVAGISDRERAIDGVLQDSFPASDPPSWNPGVARPDPSVREPVDHAGTTDTRSFLEALVSVAGAAALVLTVPFVILLIGLPFALAIRGLLEVIAWVFGIAIV